MKISNEEAKAILLQLLFTQNGPAAVTPGISIQKTMDDFLRRKKNAGLSADSIEGYTITFNKIGQVVDIDIDISNFNQEIFEKFVELLLDRGLKKSGINRRIREIRTFYNDCKKRGLITCNIEIEQFRVESIPLYISELKQNRILAEMKPEHREYIKLYLSTGARLNEIYNATLESDNFLVIPAELCKTRRPIEIELSPENVIIYKKLMASGLSSARLSRLFKAACVKAGLPEFHFHNLRATAGLELYIRSGDIYRVATLLHHSTVKTTESHYLVHSKRRLSTDFTALYAAM